MTSPKSLRVLMNVLLVPASIALAACAHQGTAKDDGNPCFHWVADGNLTELQNNINTCKKTNNKSATSLMMFAASRDRVEVLNYLFEQEGRNIESLNEYDLSGSSPLFYAAATSKNKAIQWLLENGAATKSFRADKISPFMIAIQFGNQQSFEYFLKSKSQIEELNIANEDGWTPLFFAVRQENIELVQKLLELGAETQILSKENDTPLTLADEQQWKAGITLIKKFSQKKKPHNKK